jgi:hypothetical protein
MDLGADYDLSRIKHDFSQFISHSSSLSPVAFPFTNAQLG